MPDELQHKLSIMVKFQQGCIVRNIAQDTHMIQPRLQILRDSYMMLSYIIIIFIIKLMLAQVTVQN